MKIDRTIRAVLDVCFANTLLQDRHPYIPYILIGLF